MDFFKQVILIILPIITTSLSGYIVWYLQSTKKKDDAKKQEDIKRQQANAEGTKLMLLYMIERFHTEYKLQGYVSHIQRERFKDLYFAYHNLGGNGYGTALWEDIKSLEIRNDVETISPYAKLLKDVIDKDNIKKASLND